MKVTMDRYLPKWKWDRFENYQNDYRWSLGSPPVEVKAFRRYYNVTSENLDKIDIHWMDLGTFKFENSATSMVIGSMGAICSLVMLVSSLKI